MLRIIVNGKEVSVSTSYLSFRELVLLANKQLGFLPTITYHNSAGTKESGTLYWNQVVKVKEGTVINVTFTGDA